jgi:hypothetical protein
MTGEGGSTSPEYPIEKATRLKREYYEEKSRK